MDDETLRHCLVVSGRLWFKSKLYDKPKLCRNAPHGALGDACARQKLANRWWCDANPSGQFCLSHAAFAAHDFEVVAEREAIWIGSVFHLATATAWGCKRVNEKLILFQLCVK